ncbi:transcription termination factor NusA [Mycoplasma marinum]|uniref:Transcription termination/antitermination protein NusA n=1 Tax=Mycoplasma marinum TaxID=1937190 RepID=A0A4R0XMH3_9MOLU|nr:transcription termination factor NusA [Mycoplasma marinum]TCG11909.1 transcription termination factor NusA [Mycoplasma marinum]
MPKTLNKEQLFIAIDEIAKTQQLSREEIDAILEEAVTKSFHSKFDPDADLTLVINREENEFKLINNAKVVVEEEESEMEPELRTVEIPLHIAKQINPSIKIDDTIAEEVSFEVYSRTIAQQIKQLLIQKIKETRKAMIYAKHKGLVGEMVSATVTTSARTFAALKLDDGTDAFMPGPLKNPRIQMKLGERVNVYVEEVLEDSKAAQIIVSNSSPTMVRRVLEQEVPEIMDGTVEIAGMSRIVGERTKVAVKAMNESVDPVGAIIGAGGERISRIVEKLQGEKLDVIRFSENLNEFVASAISPAKVVGILDKDGFADKKIVIVPNVHHTLAIGRRGSNARLVAELAKVRVDITSIDQAREAGLEFTFNGNLTEDELRRIESGEKLNKRPRNNTSFSKPTNIKLDDIQGEIEDFNENVEDTPFLPVEEEETIFSDAELKEMESQFELDDELADFADVDFSDLDEIENK